MVLDPDVAAGVAHLWDATLADVLSGAVPGAPAGPPMRREDVVVADTASDAAVPCRIYRPNGPATEGPAPALVWVHGGGWRYGSLEMPEADSVAQVVAAQLPGLVVSVDHRLAPLHRLPAAVDDVVEAYRWVRDGDHDLSVDRSRVALGGASAGGHLALAAAQQLRDEGHPPAALFLAYPVTDPLDGPYPDERHPDCPPLLWLDRTAVSGLLEAAVGDDDGAAALAAPARGPLRGLPTTLLTAAEVDGLTPQVHELARRLRAAGVDVTVHDVGGVLHGYLNLVGASRPADRALALHVHWLQMALASH